MFRPWPAYTSQYEAGIGDSPRARPCTLGHTPYSGEYRSDQPSLDQNIHTVRYARCVQNHRIASFAITERITRHTRPRQDVV